MAKEWEDATWETHIYYECKAYEAAHEAYEEMNEAYEEMQEGAAEIYNEIYSDMENYADSDEEGWFYGDED